VPHRWWKSLEAELRAQRPEHLAQVTAEQIAATGTAHSPVGRYLVPLLLIGPRDAVVRRVMALIQVILTTGAGADDV
jgi:hypothetical protein